ncbi:MAG: PEP-CTERM sorting domain-containing protein [Alphaproteobacteria bacterium]|nr:PEP-CTERM sorting domain-containing protein [Alphaproteobacteria bacterium]
MRGSGGLIDPVLLVGFDPQPDPPGARSDLGLLLPAAPTLALRDVSDPPGGRQFFDVFFGLLLPATPGLLLPYLPFDLVPDPIAPAPTGTVHLRAVDRAGATLVDIFVDFASSSGGVLDGASAVAFDPQPEPPGDFPLGKAFGLEFAMTSLSDVTLTLRMSDAAGTAISFAPVPEPGGLALLFAALTSLAISNRAHRRGHRCRLGHRSRLGMTSSMGLPS